MKLLAFLLSIAFAVGSMADVRTCQGGQTVISAQGVHLDLGKGKIDVNGTPYRYILGTPQARFSRFAPAGRNNIVNIEGYILTVNEVAKVFVITDIVLVGAEG